MARAMTETLSARYEFSDREKADLGRELAEIYQHKITLEEEKKAAASQMKERADTLDLKSGSLSRQITAGFEMRQVDCTLRWDYPNVGEVTYYRTDTGAEIKVRPMTVAERQLELPLEDINEGLESIVRDTAAADAARSQENIKEFFEQKQQDETPVKHPEPPVDWPGSQEEYEAFLKSNTPPEPPVAPPAPPPEEPPADNKRRVPKKKD